MFADPPLLSAEQCTCCLDNTARMPLHLTLASRASWAPVSQVPSSHVFALKVVGTHAVFIQDARQCINAWGVMSVESKQGVTKLTVVVVRLQQLTHSCIGRRLFSG